jgi:hypothetical protein
MLRTLLVALCALALPLAAAAQQDSRAVTGTVKDQTGALIVGASVTLTGGQQPLSTTTNPRGVFTFPNVAPGRYVLTVAIDGFSSVERQVAVGDRTPPINVTLRLAMTTHVDVTSELGLSSGSNLASRVLRDAEITLLPSDPQMFWQRLAEMAGVSGRPEDLAVYVDGFRRSVRLPPRETIQFIRIDANPFAPEFQEPGKGRVEIITKPGSEALMSQIALNFTDGAVNARNAFADRRPVEQYRRVSGWVTGPIIPRRWGFLFYGGRWEQDDNAIVYANTIDASGQSRTVNETIATPARTTSWSMKVNSLAGRRGVAAIMYERTDLSDRNRSVGGLNLRESGVDGSTVEDVGQFSLASTTRRTFNEFQVEAVRRSVRAQAVTPAPGIMVFDAFNGGGNQDSFDNHSRNTRIAVADAVTVAAGNHTMKAGVRVERRALEDVSRAYFGGRFTFGSDFERDASGQILLGADGQPSRIAPLEAYRRTIAGRAGYRPLQFTINQGNPEASLADWRYSWFVQDDWQFHDRLTISYGLRHVMQSEVASARNVAPRAAVAWSPDSDRKNTIRAGAGLFHTYVDAEPLLESIRLDGTRLRQLVVTEPSFFPSVPAVLDGAASTQAAIAVRAADLGMAQMALAGASYERAMPWDAMVFAGFNWQRGIHLLRSRNINAPEQAAGPAPESGPILQLESSGRSSRRELTLRWRQNLGASTSTYITYTRASSRRDADDSRTLPADSRDLSTEFGAAADDLRHTMMWGATMQLPGGWLLSPYLLFTSAPPFNIVTGRDNNRDSLFTDRPAFAEPGDPSAILTPYGLLTPTIVPGARIIPRNFGRQASRADLSLSISKRLPQRFAISVEASNVLNSTNAIAFNGVLTSPRFGQPTRALPGRRIELGLTKEF